MIDAEKRRLAESISSIEGAITQILNSLNDLIKKTDTDTSKFMLVRVQKATKLEFICDDEELPTKTTQDLMESYRRIVKNYDKEKQEAEADERK